jgi:hypothetical protein
LLGVSDEPQMLVAYGLVRCARLPHEMRPLLSRGSRKEQEGFPADGPQTSCAWAAGAVGLDSPLEIGDARAPFESFLPSCPARYEQRLKQLEEGFIVRTLPRSERSS